MLAEAVGERKAVPDFVPGVGPEAFLGTGVRTSKIETYVGSVYCMQEAVKEFGVNGARCSCGRVPLAWAWC